MDTNLDLQKKALLYLPTVAEAYAYDNKTNELMFTALANTDTSVNITTTMNDKTAGVGNAKLFSTVSDRKIEVTITTIDFRLEYFAVNIGKKIRVGNYTIQSGQESHAAVGGVVTLNHIPVGASVHLQTSNDYVSVPVSAGSQEIDLSGLNIDDECVTIVYFFEADVRMLDLAVDTAPMIVKLILKTPMFDNKLGEVGSVEYVFPAFQFSGNINSALTSSDSGTIEMSGSPNAVEGDACNAGSAYGHIIEIYKDTSELYKINALYIKPNEFELSLAGNEMQELEVFGSQGALTDSIMLDISQVTFASGDPAVATVTNGIVAPVSVGSTEITATFGDFTATSQCTVYA